MKEYSDPAAAQFAHTHDKRKVIPLYELGTIIVRKTHTREA